MGFYERRIFPFLLHHVMDNPASESLRRIVLAEATGDVLEIGFGTGLSLQSYPDGIRSVNGIDPGLRLQRYGQSHNISAPEAPERFGFEVASAEALPFADAVFDCVVSMWTLCSVPDLARSLAEVRRVLRPSGAFFFIEHGLSRSRLAQRWQRAATPVWRIAAGGCHLDRPIADAIRATGFSTVDLGYFTAQARGMVGDSTVIGRATK